MPLFTTGLDQKEKDKKLLSKAKIKAKPKKSNRLIDKIDDITKTVETNLGKFANDYIIIRDKKEFENYINACVKNGIISIDTETTGLDPMLDKIVGLCLYTPNEKACYVPINHVNYITGERIENQLSEEEIKPIFDRIRDINCVFYNATFDIRVIRNQIGTSLKCYWDGYVAVKLLNENEPSNKLKDIYKKWILKGKEDTFSFDTLFSGITFDKVPIETAYMYAAHDAIITYELYEFQHNFLTSNIREGIADIYKVMTEIEMPIVDIVCDMEDLGVALDLAYSKELSEKYHQKLSDAKKVVDEEINKHYDKIQKYIQSKGSECKLEYPVNIDSPTQLAILYYDILNTPVVDKKSPRGTGKPVLKVLGDDLSKAILDYRAVNKLLTTYIDKLPQVINPNDKRVHGRFNQVGTVTGRFSSSDPNLQNIPSHNKDIRKMFKATNNEKTINSIDNTFTINKFSEIFSNRKWIYAEDLKVGDKLTDCNSEEDIVIKSISSEKDNIIIEF